MVLNFLPKTLTEIVAGGWLARDSGKTCALAFTPAAAAALSPFSTNAR